MKQKTREDPFVLCKSINLTADQCWKKTVEKTEKFVMTFIERWINNQKLFNHRFEGEDKRRMDN